MAGKQHLSDRGIGGSAVTNYMFGIIPGAGNGIELGGPAIIAATGTPSDAITVIYADYAFPLNQYTAAIPAANPNWVTWSISRRRRLCPRVFPQFSLPLEFRWAI